VADSADERIDPTPRGGGSGGRNRPDDAGRSEIGAAGGSPASGPPASGLPASGQGEVGPDVASVLEEAARLSLLGPAPVAAAIAHARRFVVALGPERRVLDLGSGGGLPGLVLAACRPDLELVLLDGRGQRADFLRRAVGRLGWGDRVEVVHARAEEAGRAPVWRGRMDAVVARSFGPPSTTAECGAPFLRTGGRLIVSEPPEAAPDRWPASGLALLGLAQVEAPVAGLASFVQVAPCPARFPRRRHSPAVFEVAGPRDVATFHVKPPESLGAEFHVEHERRKT
jgi:hypothetical protein